MLHPCCMEPPGKLRNLRKMAEIGGKLMQHENAVIPASSSSQAIVFPTEFVDARQGFEP
jgi:hypothetical protein